MKRQVIKSFLRIMRYNVGSMIFGGLLITVVVIFKMVATYFINQVAARPGLGRQAGGSVSLGFPAHTYICPAAVHRVSSLLIDHSACRSTPSRPLADPPAAGYGPVPREQDHQAARRVPPLRRPLHREGPTLYDSTFIEPLHREGPTPRRETFRSFSTATQPPYSSAKG